MKCRVWQMYYLAVMLCLDASDSINVSRGTKYNKKPSCR